MKEKTVRAVITGATGMIGISLVRQCLEEGMTVYAVVRPGSVHLGRLAAHPHLHAVPCELGELSGLPEKIGKPCRYFFHLGWANTGRERNKTEEGQNINIAYETEAVRAAAALSCTRFIGAGSQAEYGPKDLPVISPDTPAEPTEFYGKAKLAAMQAGRKTADALHVDFLWARIFSTYGPNDKPTTMISENIRRMLRGEETAYTPAVQRWDYLYVDDMAKAILLIGEKGKAGSIYCLGSGQGRPLKEFIRIMTEAVDPTIVPGIGRKPYPPGKVRNLCADISSLQADTGFTPCVSFEEGIRKTVEEIRRTMP